jgi:hypothetical protein
MKRILAIILCLMLLTGCTENNSTALLSDQNIQPNIMTLDSEDNRYYYIVDRNRHVVYLMFYAGYHAGMTVVLKTDGTPMLAEDLGIEVK